MQCTQHTSLTLIHFTTSHYFIYINYGKSIPNVCHTFVYIFMLYLYFFHLCMYKTELYITLEEAFNHYAYHITDHYRSLKHWCVNRDTLCI